MYSDVLRAGIGMVITWQFVYHCVRNPREAQLHRFAHPAVMEQYTLIEKEAREEALKRLQVQ